MTDFSDNALMTRVQQGELDQMGLLFERYNKQLLGFFFNMTGNRQMSEDLVQNTFMRVIRYRKAFKANREFRVWLFRIARNLCYDHFRKARRRPEEQLDAWAMEMADDTPNSEGRMTIDEDMELLQISLARLDDDKREILMLSKIEGMKYRDIGNLLDCTEGAVKAKVFRALKCLRDEFENTKSKF